MASSFNEARTLNREVPGLLSLVWISRGWSVYLESDTMAGYEIHSNG